MTASVARRTIEIRLVVMPMVWAALFFISFCALAFGAVLRFARGRSGVPMTGPKRDSVDYDNPYGIATFFWGGRKAPALRSQPEPRAASGDGPDGPGFGFAHGWYGFARDGEIRGDALPERISLDTAYRAAYYLVEQYAALEVEPGEGLTEFIDYLRANPARWDDWRQAVLHVMTNARTDDPLAENLDRRD